MITLIKEENAVFKEFYTGKNGSKTVNCILDNNCVRYIVFEGLRIIKRKEFNNDKKNTCFANAQKQLNK